MKCAINFSTIRTAPAQRIAGAVSKVGIKIVSFNYSPKYVSNVCKRLTINPLARARYR